MSEYPQTVVMTPNPLLGVGITKYLNEQQQIPLDIIACIREPHEIKASWQPHLLITGFLKPSCSMLRDLASEISQIWPETRLLIYCGQYPESPNLGNWIAQGIRGCLLQTEAPDVLLQAIQMLLDGYLFFPECLWIAPVETGQNSDDYLTRRLRNLWPREKMVLRLFTQNLTKRDIAHQLNLSIRTVEKYQTQILKKLQVHHGFGLIHPQVLEMVDCWKRNS